MSNIETKKQINSLFTSHVVRSCVPFWLPWVPLRWLLLCCITLGVFHISDLRTFNRVYVSWFRDLDMRIFKFIQVMNSWGWFDFSFVFLFRILETGQTRNATQPVHVRARARCISSPMVASTSANINEFIPRWILCYSHYVAYNSYDRHRCAPEVSITATLCNLRIIVSLLLLNAAVVSPLSECRTRTVLGAIALN